jgi:AraC family transcriptional regulator
MTELKPPRIATGRPMLFAGIRQHHAFADATQTIPRQWDAFRQLGPIAGEIVAEPTAEHGPSYYGVVCGNDVAAQTFEYMCAIEVTDLDSLPADLGRVRILAQTYAVFTHQGHISGLQATWNSIWNEWLPASGYLPADVPDFEIYDDRFDPKTGLGLIEIWFPIID